MNIKNYELKSANDWLGWLVLLSRRAKNLKSLRVNKTRSRTRQAHNNDIVSILLTSSVCTVG